jgi:hypothetical protein
LLRAGTAAHQALAAARTAHNPSVVADALPVKVMFNNELVDRPNVVRLRIVNTGKTPIKTIDYNRPIEITFKGAKYLQVDAIAGATKEIQQQTVFEELGSSRYAFTLDLLKPKEWFELRFVTDGESAQPSVSSRIGRQRGPMRLVTHDEDGRRRSWMESAFEFMVLGFILVALAFLLQLSGHQVIILGTVIAGALAVTLIRFAWQRIRQSLQLSGHISRPPEIQ